MSHSCRACRSCAGPVSPILDLGQSPVANRLLHSADELAPRYPLGLVQCGDCGLVQNATHLPGALLFGADYPYFASVSATVRAHAGDLAQALAARLPRGARSLEIGSNDGAVQMALARHGIRCLGVDPASGPAKAARAAGMDTMIGAFDAAMAARIRAQQPAFDAVHMSNVLAHLGDPGGLLRAAATCLADDGLLLIEVQSWLALAHGGGFDMVYHEHHSHFSLTSLAWLCRANGFAITDVQFLPMQGGSLRVWTRKGHAHAAPVAEAIEAEAVPLAKAAPALGAAVARFRRDVPRYLDSLGGAPLYGYGAAAKTVSLIAASGVDWPLAAIADAAPSKVGLFLPIGGVPIIAPDSLPAQGGAMVLFAWNLAHEIAPAYPQWRIHVPVPALRSL